MPRGMNSHNAPTVASTTGKMPLSATLNCAPGTSASQASSRHSQPSIQADATSNGAAIDGNGKSTHPSSVSGTTTKLTRGDATRLATKPINDVLPNRQRESGSKAMLIAACALSSSLTQPRSPREPGATQHTRKPTPANDNQKPAESTASGSNTSTASIANASSESPPARRRASPASTTTPIISSVRTVGSPSPASR